MKIKSLTCHSNQITHQFEIGNIKLRKSNKWNRINVRNWKCKQRQTNEQNSQYRIVRYHDRCVSNRQRVRCRFCFLINICGILAYSLFGAAFRLFFFVHFIIRSFTRKLHPTQHSCSYYQTSPYAHCAAICVLHAKCVYPAGKTAVFILTVP